MPSLAKKRTFFAIALAIAAFSSSKSVSAAQITQSNSVNSQGLGTAIIELFNPNLGTLNSVTESFNGSFSVPSLGSCYPDTINGVPETGASCQITYTFSEISPFLGVTFGNSITGSVSPTVAGPTDIPGGSAAIIGSESVPIASFISPDPNVTVFRSGGFIAKASWTHTENLANTFIPSDLLNTTSVSGTLDVVYDYSPATSSSVPEPGSLALLSTAVVWLGFVRFRQRQRNY